MNLGIVNREIGGWRTCRIEGRCLFSSSPRSAMIIGDTGTLFLDYSLPAPTPPRGKLPLSRAHIIVYTVKDGTFPRVYVFSSLTRLFVICARGRKRKSERSNFSLAKERNTHPGKESVCIIDGSPRLVNPRGGESSFVNGREQVFRGEKPRVTARV